MVLLNQAGAYRLMGDHEKALATFTRARTLLERNETTPPATLAALDNNIGLVYMDLGRPAEAEALFRRALTQLDDAHQTELGTTWCDLAAAQQAQGRLEEALVSADRAEQAFLRADGGTGSHFAAIKDLRGVLLYRQGRYDEALACFADAVERVERVYGHNGEYADGCRNCAACCERLGREEEALRWRERAKA